MTYKDIMDRIKTEMYRRGWSYSKLATEAMVGTSTVYPILNRNATTNISTVIKLLDAVGLTLEVMEK